MFNKSFSQFFLNHQIKTKFKFNQTQQESKKITTEQKILETKP